MDSSKVTLLSMTEKKRKQQKFCDLSESDDHKAPVMIIKWCLTSKFLVVHT